MSDSATHPKTTSAAIVDEIFKVHRLSVLAGLREAALMAASWRGPAALQLADGKLTVQELRVAQACAAGIEAAIRARIAEIEGEDNAASSPNP